MFSRTRESKLEDAGVGRLGEGQRPRPTIRGYDSRAAKGRPLGQLGTFDGNKTCLMTGVG
jgi:hypothetical protein